MLQNTSEWRHFTSRPYTTVYSISSNQAKVEHEYSSPVFLFEANDEIFCFNRPNFILRFSHFYQILPIETSDIVYFRKCREFLISGHPRFPQPLYTVS